MKLNQVILGMAACSFVLFSSTGCGDDGDTKSSDVPTCQSVCEKQSECVILDDCIAECEMMDTAAKAERIECLNTAVSNDQCASAGMCFPDIPTGACYYQCDMDGVPVRSCSGGSDMTEDACEMAATEACGNLPQNFEFKVDCECDASDQCTAPAWYQE